MCEKLKIPNVSDDLKTISDSVLETAGNVSDGLYGISSGLKLTFEDMMNNTDSFFDDNSKKFNEVFGRLSNITNGMSAFYGNKMQTVDNEADNEVDRIDQLNVTDEERTKLLEENEKKRYEQKKKYFEKQKAFEIASS